ncbi:hypothetical protein RB195_002160 [Necator americanus]|uniref:7TM GPCR serpentine receptor class x (Srx) domain-containing protein n=1 Tax=Necator americanus TaxID=51031 RepID=A0ABR1DHX0_NECAM
MEKGEALKDFTKKKMHPKKSMVTVWRCATVVVHYSFISPSETTTVEKYCKELDESEIPNSSPGREQKKDRTMDVDPTPAIRIICALLILIPSLVGFVLQIVVLAAFCLDWKTMRSSSFYIIMVQIMGCNTCSLFLDLYIAFPLTLTGIQYMGDSNLLYHGPLFFEGVAFQGLLLHSFLLTITRVTVFFFPKWNEVLFSPKGTILLSMIVWIYIFALLILYDIFGCKKQFSKDGFYFGYRCEISVRGGPYIRSFMMYQGQLLPFIMTLSYIAIYFKIKAISRSATTRRNIKAEMRFLWQTIPLTVLLSIQVLAFTFIPKFYVTGYGRFFTTSTTSLIIIANNMASPIVLLIFNKDIWKYTRRMLRCKSSEVLPVLVTSGNDARRITVQMRRTTTTE